MSHIRGIAYMGNIKNVYLEKEKLKRISIWYSHLRIQIPPLTMPDFLDRDICLKNLAGFSVLLI